MAVVGQEIVYFKGHTSIEHRDSSGNLKSIGRVFFNQGGIHKEYRYEKTDKGWKETGTELTDPAERKEMADFIKDKRRKI